MDDQYRVRFEADRDDEYVDTLSEAESLAQYDDLAIYAPGQMPGADKPLAIWRDGEPID